MAGTGRAGSRPEVGQGPGAILEFQDGLRAGSVNPQDTPALWSIRRQGVNFANSHSLFPTFTMANASAIATGHGLGDTGIFSNDIWVGFATYSGTPIPFLENDRMLLNVYDHYKGNFPTDDTLLRTVWGYHHDGYQRTVDSHITRVRRKLESAGASPAMIVTVHGVGYRFEPPAA